MLLVLMKKQNLKLGYQFVNIYFANSKEIGRYQIILMSAYLNLLLFYK